MILAKLMTKMNFRKLGILSAMIITTIFVLTFEASAQNSANKKIGADKREEKKSEIQAEKQAKFCERISELASKISQRFSDKQEKIRNRNQERLSNWEENQSGRDAKLADLRSKRDSNLEEHFRKLEERAQTEEQKNAVAEFKETVRNAIEARREAIDAAIEKFRADVKTLQTSRKTTIEGDAEDFISAQKSAFEKAQSDCEKLIDPKTVRQTLHSSLKLAKSNYGVEKQNREKIRTQMQTLIQTRKSAIEKAIADFKTTMEAAKVKLKTVLSDGVGNPE